MLRLEKIQSHFNTLFKTKMKNTKRKMKKFFKKYKQHHVAALVVALVVIGSVLAFQTQRPTVAQVSTQVYILEHAGFNTCATAEFTTIQTAINAALSGETVVVCDGTYTSGQINIDKSLVLRSKNGHTVTKILGTSGNAIFITGNPSGVTIEGFEITKPGFTGTGTESVGIVSGGSSTGGASNIVIRNNRIHTVRDPSVPDCGFVGALGIALNFVKDVLIEDNIIEDIDNDGCFRSFTSKARGIFVKGQIPDAGSIVIRNNIIDDVLGERAIGINVISMPSSSLKIEGNTITRVIEAGVSATRIQGTIGIELDGVATTFDPTGNIVGNSIDGVTMGVRLESVGVNVIGNTFTNLIPGGFARFGLGASPYYTIIGGAATGNKVCENIHAVGDKIIVFGTGNTFLFAESVTGVPEAPGFPPGNTNCTCGNGVIDAGETCDDQNGVDGDGCSASCQSERPPDSDGDGVLDDEDACPAIAGRPEFQGCPVGDKNTVVLHTIDQAKSGACPGGKGSCKSPLADAEVKVFDRNKLNGLTITTLDATTVTLTKNPNGQLYDDIFESANAASAQVGSCTTDTSGVCIAGEPSTGDYLVIVKSTDVIASKTAYTGLPKSPSDFINGLASKEFQFIKVIKKDSSKQLAGGSKKSLKGSLLDIVYPLNAQWEAGVSSYIYPFIFTSDSSWSVDVCAQVPTGYNIVGVYDANGNLLADKNNCVQSFVTGETKVVAYDVLMTGSPPQWALDARLRARGPNGRVQTLNLSVPSVVLERAEGKPFTDDEFTPKGKPFQ